MECMKRHDALIPFSHDHQHALANALRLRRASARDDQERRDGALAFLAFVDAELPDHFREEEELLERAAALTNSPELEAEREQLARQHEQLRERFEQLRAAVVHGGVPDGETLHATGTALTAHIRYEERELFEQLQQALGGRLHDLT